MKQQVEQDKAERRNSKVSKIKEEEQSARRLWKLPNALSCLCDVRLPLSSSVRSQAP